MEIMKNLNRQPLLRLTLMLILGIVIGDTWGDGIPVWVWLCFSAIAITIAITLGRRSSLLQGAGIMVATITIGITVITLENQKTTPVESLEELSYEAVLMSEPIVRGKTIRCDLTITKINGHALDHPIKVKAGIMRDTITNRWQRLHLGDGIRAQSMLDAPKAFYAKSNFDYVRWLRTHGFRSQTFIYYSDWQKAAVSLSSLSLFERTKLRALRLRQKLLSHYRMLGLDEQQYAVIAAMTLGEKSQLSRQLKDDYSVTGASHVLALSGLHLSIIYAVLTLLLGRSRRWRWLSQGAILLGIWMFVVLVGLPTSAIRSATMLSVYSVCLLLNRQKASINTLSFAAAVMLLVNPLNLWDIGFQMSFMAVLAILLFYRTLYHLITLRNVVASWLWGMTVVSIAAQIGTAPLVMYYFERFSSYFLITNFIVIPSATIILYGAVAMMLAMPFLALQQLIAKGLVAVATILNDTLATFARLPWASIEGIRISTMQLYLIYILVVSLTVLSAYLLKIKSHTRFKTKSKYTNGVEV